MPRVTPPPRPSHTLIPDALLDRVAQRFKVLSDPNRLAILRMLVADGESTVGEIVERQAMSQANVSKHLRHLLDAGILRRRAEGTSAHYSVVDSSVEQLCAIVCDRIESQVRAEADSLRR